jgi:monoamine oxidase
MEELFMANEKIDIAIVGGGVSGVYSAWKLKKKYPKKNIVVFEGSDHVGGRLLSVVPPGIPDMVAELGGMRILENNQVLIVNLIKELNKALPKNQQIELYDFPVNEAQNIAYLRGVYLRLQDFNNNSPKVPYNLSFLERENMNGILVNAIEQIVPGVTNPKLTNEERLKMTHAAEFGGMPLYKQGFWNVLARVISSEAYQFSMDSGGYDSILVNWNAADAIPWFLGDFGITPKYKGFKNGFQQVPIALAGLFEKLGGTIRLNAKLSAFEKKPDGFELTVNNKKISAGQLILAMPRRSLDLLAPKCPLLQLPEVQALIGSVTPRPLFKVFTTYANPWWLAAGVQSGRTVTDLPVRQTYYWPKKDGKPATSGKAMLLASYDDGTNIGFWDGLRPQRKKAWAEGLSHAMMQNPFEGVDEGKTKAPGTEGLNQKWEQYEAPEEMIREMSSQLQEIHDLSYTPVVRNACFRDWGEDPYGGGWNSWNIGVNSEVVKYKITNPVEGCPLYICGEAYSDGQGWVEGALQTADIMLAKLIK